MNEISLRQHYELVDELERKPLAPGEHLDLDGWRWRVRTRLYVGTSQHYEGFKVFKRRHSKTGLSAAEALDAGLLDVIRPLDIQP